MAIQGTELEAIRLGEHDSPKKREHQWVAASLTREPGLSAKLLLLARHSNHHCYQGCPMHFLLRLVQSLQK